LARIFISDHLRCEASALISVPFFKTPGVVDHNELTGEPVIICSGDDVGGVPE
jgi:hypothetical protein